MSVRLVLILSIFAVAPLFYPGYVQTHSGFVPVWNVADLRDNLGDFGWVPKIAIMFDPVRGAGILPYYLAAIVPFSPSNAVKLVVGGSWLLGGLGIYLWLKSWLGNRGAVIAALVYIYLPFQIATVYVRGAWGETLFWGLLPWAILTTTYLVTSPYWSLVPVAASFWLILGLTHLGLSWWGAFFVVLLLLLVHFAQAKLPIVAIFSGLAVASIISMGLAPASSQTSPIFSQHFLFPFQLLSANWGVGPSTPGWDDGLSLQLGLVATGLSLLTVILWQRGGTTSPPVSRIDPRLLFFTMTVLITILLQLGVAPFLWQLPIWPGYALSDTLTYPWQLLGLTGLCLAVLAGAALWLDEQLTRLPLFAAAIILVILSSYNYLLPQFVNDQLYEGGPEAQFGEAQLTLLKHNFSILTQGETAGFTRGETTIPLSIHGPPQAGDILILNAIWQPLQPLQADLKVFVHLIDANGQVLAQFDGQPQGGNYPTSQWVPGELITDSYPILLPPDASPGPYQVFLGFYEEATLLRLPVPTDDAGRVRLNVE